MPKLLFYAGAIFALLIAVISAVEAAHELQSGTVTFIALHGGSIDRVAAGGWTLLGAFGVAVAMSAIFLRMASLLAARNLFASFMALFSIVCTFAAIVGVLFVQFRLLIVTRGLAALLRPHDDLSELHLIASLMAGCFLSLTFLSLRPYFRIQASRALSTLVFLPAPIFAAVLGREVFLGSSAAPLPPVSPASFVYFALLAVLFFSVGVHCIRHRHLFLEMTNLRELLDVRVEPSSALSKRPLRLGGDVAFDS